MIYRWQSLLKHAGVHADPAVVVAILMAGLLTIVLGVCIVLSHVWPVVTR